MKKYITVRSLEIQQCKKTIISCKTPYTAGTWGISRLVHYNSRYHMILIGYYSANVTM